MEARRGTISWRRMLAVLAVAAAVLAMAVPRATAADDEDDLPDVRILRNVLEALGLRRDGGAGIDYRERSPLVVPPSMSLPPPQTESMAERNPNWPSDPDVRMAQEARAARGQRRHADAVVEERVPTPAELDPGRRGPPVRQLPWEFATPEEAATPQRPSALGYFGGLFTSVFSSRKEEYKPFTGEPPRISLTQPPPGYRTPAPNHPYGVGRARAQLPDATKPEDHAVRH